MRRQPIITLFVAAVSLPATAQQTLPAITVTDKAIEDGGNALALTPETIRSLRARYQTTAALFRELPGGSVLAGGALSPLPVVRGLADERLRVTIDGADLTATCPNHMNTPLSYIEPTSIEQLTLYPSVTPVSVGGDAIGGAVVVERRKAPFASDSTPVRGGEAGATYRSNGNGKAADFAAWYGTETFAAQYQGSFAESDNLRAGGPFKNYRFTGRLGHTLDTDAIGSTAYQVRNHAVDFGWKSGEHEVRAEVGLQQQPYQLYPNQRMDLLDNEEKRAALTYRGRFAWGELEARLYHETVDHFMDFGADKRYWYGRASGGPTAFDGSPCAPLGPTCAAGMPMYASSTTDGAKIKATVALDDASLVRVGGEWNRYTLDDWWPPSGGGMWPDTFWNIRNGVRERTALFTEWERALSPTWHTTLGVRVERVTTDADPVHGYANSDGTAPSFTYQLRDSTAFNTSDRSRSDTLWNLVWSNSWQLSPEWSAALDLAHQSRAPSLYERYPWSTWQMAALMNNFVGDGNGYIGNLDLKPEQAYTAAARLAWQASDQGWRIEWRPYLTVIEDYIDAVQWDATANAPRATPVTNRFTVLKYVNQRAKLYGHELTLRGPLARNGWGAWAFAATLACSRGSNTETGDNLYGVMPRNVKLTLDQTRGQWQQRFIVEAVERKSRTNRIRNEIPTAGYALLHWQGSLTLSNAVTWHFGIDNVFDRSYAHPLGGAYIGQGTTMTNPTPPNVPQWGTPVPGPGRTIWTGLRVRF